MRTQSKLFAPSMSLEVANGRATCNHTEYVQRKQLHRVWRLSSIKSSDHHVLGCAIWKLRRIGIRVDIAPIVIETQTTYLIYGNHERSGGDSFNLNEPTCGLSGQTFTSANVCSHRRRRVRVPILDFAFRYWLYVLSVDAQVEAGPNQCQDERIVAT